MTAVQQLTLILMIICIMIALVAWKIRQLERRIKALEDKNLKVETEYGSWEDYKRFKESRKNTAIEEWIQREEKKKEG